MNLPARCLGCAKNGPAPDHLGIASWCTCTGVAGPYVALPSHITVISYMTPEQTADLGHARAIKNAYIAARDAGADARWTATGRPRPRSSRIYRAWARRMRAATVALEQLQATCRHAERSQFSREHCARCAAHLGSN